MLAPVFARCTIALGVVVWTCGCTGLALESTPGGDGPSSVVSAGGLAVDPRTETTFVMQRAPAPDGGAPGDPSVTAANGGPVFAIDPDTGASRAVTDLTGLDSIRVLFPRSSVMVMGEDLSAGDVLMRFDDTTLAMTQRVSTTASFWGTRTSPTGTYVAVADNSKSNAPVNVIEADSLSVHAMPWGGQELEAMWMNRSDTLVAILFDQGAGEIGTGRIMTWSLPALAAGGFATSSDGTWASPTLDVPLANVGFDFDFSYTWIAVSPDDTTAAFPVIRNPSTDAGTTGNDHQVLVVDLASGALHTVDDAYGPVGYTPDGHDDRLVQVRGVVRRHPATPARRLRGPVVVGDGRAERASSVVFSVTREGNDVVVASNLGNADLAIYDITMHKFVAVGGPPLGLENFVSRIGYDQLWIVDRGLYTLNFQTAVLKGVPLSWTPLNINILPTRDLLVLDDANSGAIRFFSPSTLAVERTVNLPLAPSSGR